ncbi:MAG TPA: hypothetical protein VJT67_08470 [Longimicrobiaceae bacterium]|nr:hypothetical protein [Longimicrobiaceae bacterium]
MRKSLSQQRIEAYAVPGDRDEIEGMARYLWNMRLAATLQGSLHIFEITLRNAIYDASTKLVDTTRLRMPDIPCWLDATNATLLYPQEFADVQRAKSRLAPDPRRRTPGHLIAKLGFGFWVQLTSRVYNELRGDGPKLWPRGLPLVFPFKWPPGSKKIVPAHPDREMIFDRLQRIRELRNRIAHHEPIWDRNIAATYQMLLEVLGWTSPKMAAAVCALDAFPAVLAGGTEPCRRDAERLLLGS